MKRNNKKNFNKFKANTLLLVFCVICFTFSSIGISYSLFFQVKASTSEQVITTGNLKINVINNTSANNSLDFLPDDDLSDVSDESSYIFSISNSGTTDSGFYFYLDASDNNYVQSLKAVVYSVDVNGEYVLISDVISFAEVSLGNAYVFYYDEIMASSVEDEPTTANYVVKFWLSDLASDDLAGESLNFSVSILADVAKSTMNYTLNGILYDSAGSPEKGADISLLNGSYSATSSSSGEFTLTGLRSGTYPVNFTTVEGEVYTSSLVIKEDSEESFSSSAGYVLTGGVASTFDKTLNVSLTSSGTIEMEYK